MKIKTSELTVAALDWAVAKCEGLLAFGYETDGERLWVKLSTGDTELFMPHIDWSQGGPTLSRLLEGGMLLERCDPAYKNLEKFKASMNLWETTYRGNTPLIAAMRCYVASMLGDEVEIPDELIGE